MKDFAHVTLAAQLPSMLTVHPSLPVKSVKELVGEMGEGREIREDPA